MPVPILEHIPIDYRLLAGAWVTASAWGSVLTLAQAPTGEASPGVAASQYTAFGLLATVLIAVGAFLRWYLPHRESCQEAMLTEQRKAFVQVLGEQRADFGKMLTEQREAAACVLADEREHHRQVLELMRPGGGEGSRLEKRG